MAARTTPPPTPRAAVIATAARWVAASAVAVSTVAATAALAVAAPPPAAPAPDPPAPSCGTASDAGFPIGTRISGGPAEYPAGGAFQAWNLDLTNTTEASCTGIHPVLVLTDRERSLRPDQVRFEFYDDGSARWRPVAFEATEEAENVGAFTGFGGFAVPAGGTLTVPVRLSFRKDTAPDEVVVTAAVVQRRGGDGDWVGESGDYRLTVGPAVPDPSGTPEATGDASSPPAPTAKAPRDPRAPRDPKDPRGPKGDIGRGPSDELARTGRESDRDVLLLAPCAAALVLLGAALVRTARRHRHH
ncbi:hypothetical protein ABZY68_09880 [Streptomyces sp. NPDC006482]|uniref:hypothetical protein n=1 Tax=Streptomyces sp. NPDC006482 TaxID=3154306 RepID=UPI0033B055C2